MIVWLMADWIRWIALLSVALYFVIDFLDGRRVKDEREDLIKLKAHELTHKFTCFCLGLLTGLYAMGIHLATPLVLLVVVAATLYGEIAAKLYFRWKL